MPALLLLAVALGLDNLAAAVGFGVGATGRTSGATRFRIAVVFGLFEAGMPVLGLVLGHGLADSIGEAARVRAAHRGGCGDRRGCTLRHL